MIKLKENLIPFYLMSMVVCYVFTTLFFFYDENRNLLFVGGTVFISSIFFYIRGGFSKYGLHFSENLISFRDIKEEFNIPWKNLNVEISEQVSFPVTKKKYFFQDKTKFHNAFYYEINFQNKKSFNELVIKYAPRDHEIHKLLNQ